MTGPAHLTSNEVVCGPWTNMSLTPQVYSVDVDTVCDRLFVTRGPRSVVSSDLNQTEYSCVQILFFSRLRLYLNPDGLAVTAVGGSTVSLPVCAIIGWSRGAGEVGEVGGDNDKWKELCSRSPLFLSSCVLTFSPSTSPPLPVLHQNHTLSQHAQWDRGPAGSLGSAGAPDPEPAGDPHLRITANQSVICYSHVKL